MVFIICLILIFVNFSLNWQCQMIDPASIWLHETLSVEDIPVDSFLLEKTCLSGYYLSSLGERYCRYDCLEAQCGPVSVADEYSKPCKKCVDTSQCYEETRESQEITGTHYVLHVAAIPSPLCQLKNVLVYGETCKQHHITDRPIIGYINFCVSEFDYGGSQYAAQMMHVVRELLKILAFSRDLLPFFCKPSGEPLMPRTIFGKPRQDSNGHYAVDYVISSIYMYYNWTSALPVNDHYTEILVLPTVVQKAKEHFNCSDLIGVPLEDQLELKGRLLWEQRVMMGDIMTAQWLTRPVISPITLALFEDSGWYVVNYDYAGIFSWGKGMGCNFVTNSCQNVAMKKGQHSFCNIENRNLKGCTLDYKAVASCCTVEYTYNLPKQFQYKRYSHNVGGPIPVADYCPLYHTSSYCTLYCTGTNNGCIEHEGVWNKTKIGNKTDHYPIFEGAGCYEITCSGKWLHINVHGKKIACNSDFQVKHVTFVNNDYTYKGKIICPPRERFCQAFHCVNDCYGNGRCIDGFCLCYPGYYGEDCRYRYFSSCDRTYCYNYPQTFRMNSCGCYCQCVATSSYGGYRCSIDIPYNLCALPYKSNCGNGRCTRVNHGKNRLCICNPGYEGKKCNKQINNNS